MVRYLTAFMANGSPELKDLPAWPAPIELSFGNPIDPESHYVCGPAELLETMETHEIGQATLIMAWHF